MNYLQNNVNEDGYVVDSLSKEISMEEVIIKSLMNEQTANVVLELMNLFADLGYGDFFEEIDPYIYGDELDMDENYRRDQIIVIVHNYIKKFLNQTGIIVEPDYFNSLTIEKGYEIIQALLMLNEIDLPDVLYIIGQTASDEYDDSKLEDRILLLYNLLSYFNNEIEYNYLTLVVKDISTSFFEFIESKILSILKANLDSIESTPEDNITKKVLDIWNNLPVSDLPETVLLFLLDNRSIRTLYRKLPIYISKNLKSITLMLDNVENERDLEILILNQLLDLIMLSWLDISDETDIDVRLRVSEYIANVLSGFDNDDINIVVVTKYINEKISYFINELEKIGFFKLLEESYSKFVVPELYKEGEINE